MEQHPHPYLAALSSVISLTSASICLITASDVQPYFTLAGSIIAIASGLFAIRYYYFATKKIK
jgi:hypothetical protein|tara:strand:- start:397 stop:585 length:189 start_codon:yes stop_codon:yes gene_type:complete